MVSPQTRREAVLVMQVEVKPSQRRACGLMELHPATYRYRRRRSEEPQLRTRLRELAEARCRFCSRRLQVLLLRKGWHVNHKHIYRLYVEIEAIATAQTWAQAQPGAATVAECSGRQSGGQWTS